MKKMFLFVCFIAVAVMSHAGDDKAIQKSELPQKAQQFIASYFANTEISYAKMDNELFDKSYEVVFVNGNKVEFERNGEWNDVDCKYTKVPDAILPQAIKDYVTKNFQSQSVIKIDKGDRSFEVELNNGIELKFDLKGNFIKRD